MPVGNSGVDEVSEMEPRDVVLPLAQGTEHSLADFVVRAAALPSVALGPTTSDW